MNERNKTTRELVAEACDKLWKQGIKPAMTVVREIVGPNPSASTVQSAINDWWASLAKRMAEYERTPGLPDEVAEVARQLWVTAMDKATSSFEAERKALQEAADNARAESIEAYAKLEHVQSVFRGLETKIDELNEIISSRTSELTIIKTHNEALSNQISTLQAQLANAAANLTKMQQDHAVQIDAIRVDADTRVEKAHAEFNSQMELALHRFHESEKRMSMEIHNAREETKKVQKQHADDLKRLESELEISKAHYQKQLGDLRSSRSEALSKIEVLTAKNDGLEREVGRLSEMLSGFIRNTGKRESLRKAAHERAKKNMPIVEANLGEIERMMDEGDSPTSIATWLSEQHGFEGGGAALNTVLKKLGVI